VHQIDTSQSMLDAGHFLWSALKTHVPCMPAAQGIRVSEPQKTSWRDFHTHDGPRTIVTACASLSTRELDDADAVAVLEDGLNASRASEAYFLVPKAEEDPLATAVWHLIASSSWDTRTGNVNDINRRKYRLLDEPDSRMDEWHSDLHHGSREDKLCFEIGRELTAELEATGQAAQFGPGVLAEQSLWGSKERKKERQLGSGDSSAGGDLPYQYSHRMTHLVRTFLEP
jgi:hypothetical protein